MKTTGLREERFQRNWLRYKRGTGSGFSRLTLCVISLLSVSYTANAADSRWGILQTVTSPASNDHPIIRVTLLEDQTLPLDSGILVGNIGTPANPRPRKLIVEVANIPKHPEGRIWELHVPSKTYQGDDCSVVEVSELSVDGSFVTVSMDHQFACGAGSNVLVTHKFLVADYSLHLASMRFESASREGLGLTKVDFYKGKIIEAFDRPEDDTPTAAKTFRFKARLVPVDSQALLRCHPPLHGSEVPDCSR